MATHRARKERLSIWLCKEGLNDRSILKVDEANDPVTLTLPVGSGRLYVKRDRVGTVPPWTHIFTSRPEVEEGTFKTTRSVGAVLLIDHLDRTFALSFGSGFHLMISEGVERDFGMRVALSAIDPRKMRSVDKASYEHNPLNSRTQSTTEVDIFDLRMNTDTDMLYAVTGASRLPALGSHITGRDALTLMLETDVDGLPAILEKVMELYGSKLPEEFEWFDNVRRVRDFDDMQLLDILLDEALSDPLQAVVWLGEPEIVDWEGQYGYAFDLRRRTPTHSVLQLPELAAHLDQNDRGLSVETLKSTTVHVINENFTPLKQWTAYRCLYAEVPSGDDRYILRNGTWYQISQKFVETVDRSLSDLERYAYAFPEYDYEREEDYNRAVSRADNAVSLMDQRTIPIGAPYDKVEFCDLIRNGTDLIHVKYYRSSGTLSHLFSQGHVSAEAFVGDLEFRRRLNEFLPPAHRLVNPALRPDATKYSVIYAIATSKLLPDELPFFSKVTLRNAYRTLGALRFNVKIAAIPVASSLLGMKKYKPNKAPHGAPR